MIILDICSTAIFIAKYFLPIILSGLITLLGSRHIQLKINQKENSIRSEKVLYSKRIESLNSFILNEKLKYERKTYLVAKIFLIETVRLYSSDESSDINIRKFAKETAVIANKILCNENFADSSSVVIDSGEITDFTQSMKKLIEEILLKLKIDSDIIDLIFYG